MLKPTYQITIGNYQASTEAPAAAPCELNIDRDMDVSADSTWVATANSANVALDDEVSVKLGHDGEDHVVFTGQVTSLRPDIKGNEIYALGKLGTLMNLRVSAVYENQTAGSIAKDLISQAGLTVGKADTGPTLPRFVVDNRRSAHAHLKDLANRLGYELYTNRNGQIMFHALGAAAGLDSMAALPALSTGVETYSYGQHILNADAKRTNKPLNQIRVGGESPMSSQGDTTMAWLTASDADYQGSAGDGTPARLVLDAAARTKDLADRFAAGLLATSTRKAHEIQVRLPGRAQVDLGDTVSTADLANDLLNGIGYVRGIRHRFNTHAGFITELRISQDTNV